MLALWAVQIIKCSFSEAGFGAKAAKSDPKPQKPAPFGAKCLIISEIAQI
jgi:hypothetical protein